MGLQPQYEPLASMPDRSGGLRQFCRDSDIPNPLPYAAVRLCPVGNVDPKTTAGASYPCPTYTLRWYRRHIQSMDATSTRAATTSWCHVKNGLQKLGFAHPGI